MKHKTHNITTAETKDAAMTEVHAPMPICDQNRAAMLAPAVGFQVRLDAATYDRKPVPSLPATT